MPPARRRSHDASEYKAIDDHATFMWIDDAVATSREGHR
jgi:hypothetical protein